MGDVSDLRPQYSFNIKINDTPAMGISAEAAKAGDKGSVIVRGFIYDSKGYLFFNSLEHIAQLYLNKWLIQQQLKASAIDNCLIQISPDNDIWVNVNCPAIMEMVYKQIPKIGINKGDPITRENIADIEKNQSSKYRIYTKLCEDLLFFYWLEKGDIRRFQSVA